MALILCIETATEVCSVALAREQNLLEIRESSTRNVHSAMLTVFVDEIIKSSGVKFGDLDAIAVSMGPGSYTGLRIGVATAKGLCYALDKPLIAIPTLQSMAVGINYELKIKNYEFHPDNQIPKSKIENRKSKILFCPMIDARRMEVYSAVFDHGGKEVREVRAEIIDEFSFQEFLADNHVVFGGEGADKCKPLLADHPNALFLDGFQASARFMAPLVSEKFREKQFENLAYFEPFYLKDFVAGKPRVKGLHNEY
jgi:tRNA threonylcarbamoyladenosine biosynthesis protein TsaB